MTVRIWYHANCLDGFTAAWSFYKSGLCNDAVYEPVNYGDDFPEHREGDTIYILDFSWPRDNLIQLRTRLGIEGVLLVLDHHKSAEEQLRGLPFCVFDMDRSGAGITWDHFCGTSRPLLVNAVEDRDLWKFEKPNTKAICAYLSAGPMTFGRWDDANSDLKTAALNKRGDSQAVSKVVESGNAILTYKIQLTERIGKLCVFGGIAFEERGVGQSYKTAEVNTPVLQSEVCHYLLEQHPDAEIALAYRMLEGGSVAVSLRSRKDGPDVSKVARYYGGGGHRNAAGCTIKDFIRIS